MYLYEAMSEIIRSQGNAPMRVEDIADIINSRYPNLTRARFPVSAHQVGMRAISDVEEGTPPMFEVLVRLR